jgi:two-component system, NarL family, sensor histidine kinase UhpB
MRTLSTSLLCLCLSHLGLGPGLGGPWRRLGLMLAGLALCMAILGNAQAQTLTITAALTAEAESPRFPSAGPTRAVALPDEWAASRPGFAGSLWYRVTFTPPGNLAGGELLALYIDHVCSSYRVLLNGQEIATGGRMTAPLTHNCNHPQLITLPGALLRADASTLDIQVAGHRLAEVGSRQRAGGLSDIVIGPQSELAARHAQRTALQVTAPQAVGATLLLMGGFMFVLGFINRQESHLAYFGALSVGWALLDLRLWLTTLPLSHATAEFLLMSMLGFITWVAVQFLLRYGGVRLLSVDRALPVQAALLPLSLILAGPEHLRKVATVWYVVLMAEVLAAAAWYLWRERPRRSFWLMGPLLLAMAVAGVVEFVAQRTGQRPMAAHLAALVAPVLFVIVGLRLVQQQGRARQNVENDKLILEQRVAAAAAEIENNYRQLSELRVEQVTERERKRIAADLHDDLGAKLLTIVHTSDNERISTLAREALEEMRLSVRGLTGKAVRLADALGDWRAEVVSRLAQAGIEGEWEAPEDLPQRLSARAYVQTTRILREATSNIIKHSRATLCTMKCSITDGDLLFVVQDNGDGIAPETEGRLDRGHGLASMKNRAKQLQGQCLVESGPGYGTVIRLTVPLDRATEAAPRA